MRTLILALGFAAVAAGPALAQAGVTRGSAPVAPTSSTGTATSTTGTTTTPSAVNTGGDTNLAAPPSSNTAGTSNVPPGGASTAFGTNQTTDINASTPGSPFGPGGSFSNDSGNTALGTSPGQSSSGTLAGNSSPGIGADSTGLNNGFNNDLNGGRAGNGVATVLPEGNVSVIGGGNGARVVGVPGAVSAQGTAPGATSTPLFDQAAREGRAREARRRAQGNEPRIYGIAPNTERDLTWQMPDDRIIRY